MIITNPGNLSKTGDLPKKITDVTENISKGATKVHEMAEKMNKAVSGVQTNNPVSGSIKTGVSIITSGIEKATAGIEKGAGSLKGVGQTVATKITPATQAVSKIGTSITDLQNTLEVLNAASILVDAIVNTVSGHFHPRANEQAFSNFNTKWNSWANIIENTFQHLSPSGQAKVLEQLARQSFGDNVFALGSAIKKNSAGIFGGIADFEDSIHVFRGRYRDPLEAAKKIETGVKGIVNATERVAKSINGMITTYQNAIGAQAKGNAVLDYVGNLHDAKAIAALNKTLTSAGGTASLISDASAVTTAFKSKDVGSIYSASKKTYDDTHALAKGLKSNSAATKVTKLSQRNSSATGQLSTANPQGSAQKEDNSSQKSDSYVCSGATMKCSMGTSQAKLTVLPSRTVFLTGQPMANISDHLSMINLAPFGKCRSLGFPATASATAAHHGSLTPMPCMHNTPFPWMSGKDDYIIKGEPALLKSSTCSCMWGGTISITDDGQKDTGPADIKFNL